MKLQCHGGPFDGQRVEVNRHDRLAGYVYVSEPAPVGTQRVYVPIPEPSPIYRYDIIAVDHVLRLEYRP